jgi:hypothetical protein
MKRTGSRQLVDLAAKLTLKKPDLSVIPDTDDYPWFVREFQKQLQAMESRRQLLLPNIKDDNESIAVFSDYGGESPDSKYFTYSFLICAWNQAGAFCEAMKDLRREAGLDDPFKEIAFKDFHYGPINRALGKYLVNLSNFVNGYLLTVVVEKAVSSLFGADKKAAYGAITRTLAENGFGVWKPEVGEKLLRVAHFTAYLVALLSRQGQKVFWMTDHDSIAPTRERFTEVLDLFSRLLNHYCKHNFAKVGGALPLDEKSPQLLDLLSAPDVVAGSVEHYYTRAYGRKEEPLIKAEANRVLCWLSGQGVALKRHVMVIRAQGKGVVSGALRFELKQEDTEAVFVPVVVGR